MIKYQNDSWGGKTYMLCYLGYPLQQFGNSFGICLIV